MPDAKGRRPLYLVVIGVGIGLDEKAEYLNDIIMPAHLSLFNSSEVYFVVTQGATRLVS